MDRLTFFDINEPSYPTSTFLGYSKTDTDEALSLLSSFRDLSADIGQDCAAAVFGDFVTVRFFDGDRYIFAFPIPFTDRASETGCKEVLKAMAEYSVRELIPLYISDIPRENIELLCEVFPRVDAACYSDDEDLFSALVLNECLCLSELPKISDGDITLGAIADSDAEKYFILSTDPAVTRYWGYDAGEDNPGADGETLLREARSEFDRGVAIPLGVYVLGEFVGEAVIFGFDFFGGAEIAVRLLPSAQGRGVGSRALGLLIRLSKEIGLSELKTRVLNANVGSLKMTGKFMNEAGKDGEATLFYLSLK